MAEHIKNAIDRLIDTRDYKYSHFNFTDDTGKAFDLAIRSLQAWEEVLQELEQRVKTYSRLCDKDHCMHYEDMEFSYMNCIAIINRKLAEIK